MGRRRSVRLEARLETPLRRSSRLRNIYSVSEETDEATSESLENQAITEDDGEKTTPERKDDGEESRKAGRQPTSRIPTFQSSLPRKRPTSHNVDSLTLSLTRMEGPSQQSQSKEKMGSSGDTLRAKLAVLGGRDTALPLPSVRLPPSSTDALCHLDHIDPISGPLDVTSLPIKRNQSPDHKSVATRDPGQLETTLHRPALRAELGAHIPDLLPDPEPELSIESQYASGGPLSKDERAEPEAEFKNQAVTDLSSITSPPDDDHVSALQVKLEYSEVVESCEDNMDPSLIESLGKSNKMATCEAECVKKETAVVEQDEALALSPEKKKLKEFPVEVCSEGDAHSNLAAPTGDDNISADSEDDSGKCLKTTREKKTDDPDLSPPSAHQSTTSCPSSKARGRSFPVFCLFPAILLLFGGFGQHLWHYGMPTSVSHLMVQLELHWLEGFWMPQETCSSDCRITLVESIPEGLQFPHGSPHLPSISQTWTHLLNKANSSVVIAAFYFSLYSHTEPSSIQGKLVFEKLMQLQSKGVKLQVAVNKPQNAHVDTDELTATGAEVRPIDLQAVTGGVVHTKLWVVDDKHMYVGSANMDWRSLTQVKEVGVSVEDCSCLAQDASRIFGVYWDIGAQKNGSLPPYWPGRLSALSSSKRPLVVKLNGVPARVYLSSAPPPLSARGRSDDLSTILSVIADAKTFVYISVMDYLPLSEFTQSLRFWPAIDSSLRDAACARGVEVNLLVSCWSHSPGAMFIFLQSLAVLNQPPLGCSIHAKVFEVPSTPEQQQIPFARVNHAKYMVTDRVAYIGTSNWSEDYFTHTAGVSLVVNQTGSVVGQGQQTVQSQLQEIFQRDWTSAFAQNLSHDHVERCGKRHN